MSPYHFIRYSSVDGFDLAQRLSHDLPIGTPPIEIWLDKRGLQVDADWDQQLVGAIRACESLIFIMTRDSADDRSVCKSEWVQALKFKKPIVLVRYHADADPPFRLNSRQYVDFTGSVEAGLECLRKDLLYLSSPRGILQALRYRQADAERDLRRAREPIETARIQGEIAQLKQQIAEQERIVENPPAIDQPPVQARPHEPEASQPALGIARAKFINPPPAAAPDYFQDRTFQSQLVGAFLKDEAKRLLTIDGRGGIGKTAMVCRLLKSLENGRLPDDQGAWSVDGIVYLSASGTHRINVPNLYADLCKLLPGDTAQQLEAKYKDPHASTDAKLRTLLNEFSQGGVVVLLDNFEDLVDPATLAITDTEVNEALRAILDAPQHAVKVIITTRIAPRDLLLVQPGRQIRLSLDQGLDAPYAENILRAMDVDGLVGLKTASDEVLSRAREYTRGFPRALEALYAILSADRYTTLEEILSNPPPKNVVDALVGEAFDRLDLTAERVMMALAVYGRPVIPAAVDYLLQPYSPGLSSALVLNRLVSMHTVRKEGGRYFLHPADRDYALSRLPVGEVSDREAQAGSLWTRYALLHRGAEYFKQTRQPSEMWKKLDDVAPQLNEFELRCAGENYDPAAAVLLEIDFDYLLRWGHYSLMIELHERLRNKLDEKRLRQVSTGNLGTAYRSIGQVPKAATYYEEALRLARDMQDRQGECACLGGLGNCCADLGQTARAIEYQEQALTIAREIGDRNNEGTWLGNLGLRYADLGQTDRAIEYQHLALAIDREIADRDGEGLDLGSLVDALIDAGRYAEAVPLAQDSVKIGEEIGNPVIGCDSGRALALAYFFNGDLVAARAAAETSYIYDAPEYDYKALALLGLIALRQDDRPAASRAFTEAISHADKILRQTSQFYAALDAKGLALCGLALCNEAARVNDAVAAYCAARAINKDAGVVKRVLRLFDALAMVDTEELLVEVRRTASGE